MSESDTQSESALEVARPHRRGQTVTRIIAHLLDDAIRVPGTKFRFGLDVILGLIPGYGDATSTAMGSTLLVQAVRTGVPRKVLLKMAINQLINGVVGAIPGVGDAFSMFFKSNARNYKLMRQWEGTSDGSWADKLIVGVLVTVLILVTITAVLAVWLLIAFIFRPIWENLTALWSVVPLG